MSTYGKIEILERCHTVDKHRIRPFSHAAHIHCRDYSHAIQRRIVDFGADGSFEAAANKMQEHYGITVPESSVRAITLKHASCMQNDAISALQNRQDCLGEATQFIGEIDGSMIPVVLFDEDAEGDKRKTHRAECRGNALFKNIAF